MEKETLVLIILVYTTVGLTIQALSTVLHNRRFELDTYLPDWLLPYTVATVLFWPFIFVIDAITRKQILMIKEKRKS